MSVPLQLAAIGAAAAGMTAWSIYENVKMHKKHKERRAAESRSRFRQSYVKRKHNFARKHKFGAKDEYLVKQMGR